ncbi:MAG: hypothetical protein U0270_43100 [Labilithrix sp.]
MEHNDATDKDLPADPDATELVPVDVEAMLHMELDASIAEKKASRARIPTPRPAAGRPAKESIATIRAMRAAPRASTRMSAGMPASARVPSSSRFPSSRSAIPRPPIHTLLPPRRRDEDDEDDAATRVFDRTSGTGRHSARSSLPSVKTPSAKSVAFPAPTFSAPRVSQPFHTVPAIPAAKRVVPPAADSQATPVQPILAPTSRRDLRISAFESLAPMAMSAFPSAPPPAGAKKLSVSSMFAIVFTMIFTLGSVAVMGIGAFKPSLIERARIGLVGAMKGNQKHAPPPAAAAATAKPAAAPVDPVASTSAPLAVPPVLVNDEAPQPGEKETALYLPDSAKGHRVFVDGKTLDESSKPWVMTACGKHKVQVTSAGKEQVLELPCRGVTHLE